MHRRRPRMAKLLAAGAAAGALGGGTACQWFVGIDTPTLRSASDAGTSTDDDAFSPPPNSACAALGPSDLCADFDEGTTAPFTESHADAGSITIATDRFRSPPGALLIGLDENKSKDEHEVFVASSLARAVTSFHLAFDVSIDKIASDNGAMLSRVILDDAKGSYLLQLQVSKKHDVSIIEFGSDRPSSGQKVDMQYPVRDSISTQKWMHVDMTVTLAPPRIVVRVDDESTPSTDKALSGTIAAGTPKLEIGALYPVSDSGGFATSSMQLRYDNVVFRAN